LGTIHLINPWLEFTNYNPYNGNGRKYNYFHKVQLYKGLSEIPHGKKGQAHLYFVKTVARSPFLVFFLHISAMT
jgi:hypothetical protein